MKSLHKVLDILDVYLNSGNDSMRLSDLAELSGLNKAMVNRAVKVLVQRGYLQQPEERGKYYLGTKLVNFQKIISRKRKLSQVALPHMTKLADKTRECVILTTLDQDTAIITEVVESKLLLRAAPVVGTKLPLYCTGVGKAILAYMHEPELEGYLNRVTLEQRTENTITSKEELKHHLKNVLREGVAYDDEEQYIGIRDVAAPIFNADGRVFASLGIVSPSLNFTRNKMREVAPEVKQCALNVSFDLGYQFQDANKIEEK